MKTPCEELGYKVGDEFEVIGDEYGDNIGDVFILSNDDGSCTPLFKHKGGKRHGFVCIEVIKPLAKKDQLTPQSTAEPDIVARLTQAAKASNDLPALIAELNSLLPEGYEVVRTNEPQEDMGDWRNWREGDLITIDVDSAYHWWTKGKAYKIMDSEVGLIVRSDDGDKYGIDGHQTAGEFKFHSRPSKEIKQ